MNKKVIFWTTTIDELHRNVGNVGGIAVQMNYWSQEFLNNGWKVYSLSRFESREKNRIKYLRVYYPRYIRVFLEFVLSFVYLLKVRPTIVITRGADRQLYYLSLYTSILGIKYIHFSGSDADFELLGNKMFKKIDNRLYIRGLRRIKYIVVQNANQEALLRKNHYRSQNIMTIPNIWPDSSSANDVTPKTIDFLWVGNFRDLKRPKWFVDLAKRNPQYHFTMIGGVSNKSLYDECHKAASELPNLDFMGSKSFNEVNKYFTQARCLICTSTVEGFPNTFLQAWSNNIPVLTTFDPSGRVAKYGLGRFVTDFEQMNSAVPRMFAEKYSIMQESIKSYFSTNHNVKIRYEELIKFTRYK